MARINLLPWRAELRKQRQKEFLFVLGGSAVVMLLVILYFHLMIAGWLDNQKGRNQFLSQQIAEVENRIKEIAEIEKQKEQLIARMRVIERLQRNRPEIVHVFDELVRVTPDGLYLTGITQTGLDVKIEGIAQSNARVSALMRNLDESSYFESALLDVIQAPDKTGARKFTLTVKQTVTSNEETNQPGKKR